MSPDSPLRAIAALLDPEPDVTADSDSQPSLGIDDEADAVPSELASGRLDPATIDPEVVAGCADLDHSDTDNGLRLRRHFGADLAVLEAEGARNLDYVAWVGTHWDAASGNDVAFRVAQQLGARIALETEHIVATPFEERLIALADKFAHVAIDDLTAEQKALRMEAAAVPAAVKGRRAARKKFAVSSKNKSRLEAMLACAAPFLTRRPDTFNADSLALATRTHTLRFVREPRREGDLKRYAQLVATEGHARADYITKVVPIDYDPAARCPKWDAFLDEFLPDPHVRDCVQVFSGIGLLGEPLQQIFFHYGIGANGKSVFMETLTRVFGPLAVGLPAESLVGASERSGSGAAPDLARLFGARMVRVLELPADKPLQEDLVKKLTGGEKIPVRNLFKGFFEFQPAFKAHMSGNGYPRIDGTDDGIWRRLAVIHWPIQIPVERRREFEDVLADFAPEYPGILNWLINGALVYLETGLSLPEVVRAATQSYRDEMDPIGQFVADCVVTADGSVTAREMYDAYCAWSRANAKTPFHETRFGRVMKTKLRREEGRIRRYLDCALENVPAKTRGDDGYEPPGDSP